MFRFGILCVQSMVRIRRLKLTPEPLSIMVARRDPYRMKAVRKVRKRFNPLHSFSIWFFNVYRSFFLLLDLKGNRCLCFPSLRSLGQERWGSESSCPLWTPPENRIEASLFIKSQSEPTVTCVFPYILPLTDVPVVYAFRLQLSCIVAIDCITVLYYISPPPFSVDRFVTFSLHFNLYNKQNDFCYVAFNDFICYTDCHHFAPCCVRVINKSVPQWNTVVLCIRKL